MNRRKFFGMSAGALIAAGLPLTLLPERTIMLPPRGGWPSQFKIREVEIREVEQYLINTDSVAFRWDVAWITASGEFKQYYIRQQPNTCELIEIGNDVAFREQQREFARAELLRIARREGYFKGKPVTLELPHGLMHAAYL